MKILIICGHGAGDPGAVGNGYQEAALVREIAPTLKELLSDYAEVTLFKPNQNMYQYLKTGNTFNFKEFDYVLELHFNAFNGKAYGTEILVHNTEKGTSVEQMIVDNIAKLGFTNRGVKKRSDLQNMNVCKRQGVSYALLETCFVDNFNDISLYNSKKYDIIKAIASGIVEGFGLGQFKSDVQSSTNDGEHITSANDITWELNNSFFPITDKEKFMQELDEAKSKNSSLYWGFYKLVNKIK